MQMDSDEVAQFSKDNAFENDSAAAGASAVKAAEDRAMLTELAKVENKSSAVLLWDMQKFFDSLDVAVLFEAATELNFPLKQLILSMVVHHAPRRLKMGGVIGQAIVKLGRSILAGCKRSTDLARLYTLKMTTSLARNHSNVLLFQHVDDMSNLAVASTNRKLVEDVVSYAKEFKEWTDRLKLTISPKTMIVPKTEITQQISRICVRMGIPMAVSASGVDIGVDTSAAATRRTKKQSERIDTGKGRSKRVNTLARRNNQARRLGVTSVKLSQVYGHTSVGMAPTARQRCKKNISHATGLPGPGSCTTTILRWAYRSGVHSKSTADPRVTLPLEQVKAWIGIWNRAKCSDKTRIKKQWAKQYAKLAKVRHDIRWMMVRGPIGATITTLVELGWKPIHPYRWITPGGI